MNTLTEQFIQLVRQHLKYLPPGADLVPDAPLKNYGLDSGAGVDLLLDIEDTYGVTMPEQYLTEDTFSTLASLWRAVSELNGAAGVTGEPT